MADHGLHRDAFWLFGVIVGLAVTEALAGIVPHLVNPAIEESPWSKLQDGVRLATFLVLISRFYLGASAYFEKAHGNNARSRTYGFDFLFGFMHFLLFYVAALTINPHGPTPTFFRWLLGGILLYDFFWWVAARDSEQRGQILLWCFVNGATAALAALVFLAMRYPLNRPSGEAEGCALIIVLAISLVDLAGMLNERSFITDALRKLLPEDSA